MSRVANMYITYKLTGTGKKKKKTNHSARSDSSFLNRPQQKTVIKKTSVNYTEGFSWCDREDSNLWPSGSENYDTTV